VTRLKALRQLAIRILGRANHWFFYSLLIDIQATGQGQRITVVAVQEAPSNRRSSYQTVVVF
jgi:hypothetical protein